MRLQAKEVREVDLRVLVADDVPEIADILSTALRRAGYQVTQAPDGVSALDIVLSGQVDLALLDIRMPGLDGLSVLRQIRAGGLMLPVILLTANVTQDEMQHGMRLGADAYILKPFRIADVVALLQRWLPIPSEKSSS
jgi:CheY-like chemotaxis protein